VLAALADYFEIERFHVVGVSGGGPYAFVSAWGLPERVMAAAAVSSAPPLADRKDVSRLLAAYRLLLYLYRRHPESVRLLFRLGRPLITVRPPKWVWRMLLKAVAPSDQEGLLQNGALDRAWTGYSTAWVGHPDGVFHDARVYAEPWGFDLSEIRVPVRIWHGREDRNFHWQLAEEIAAAVPTSTMRILEGEGHYSLIIRHHPQVLLDLISGAVAG
jgi:pimeloyl-ACP methyl ester carboxylesterase